MSKGRVQRSVHFRVGNMYPRPQYDDGCRQMARTMLESGCCLASIAMTLHISDSTVKRYRRNLERYGEVLATVNPEVSRGRPRLLGSELWKQVLDWAADQPQSPYAEEMSAYIDDQWGITVSRSTVSRWLKESGWSWKLAERYNPNRSDDLRSSFIGRISGYKASQLVILDESAVNERAVDRRWGWSPRGVAYRMKYAALYRSERWSLLPAMGINGYLDVEIWQGSFNVERFNLFVRRLVKKMTPFPGPRSVLLLDNASIHHGSDTVKIVEEMGGRVEFLPPYSPDFSPIEESFANLKKWLRKNQDMAKMYLREEFGEFLLIAVELSDLRGRASGYFTHCGYTVSSDDVDIDYRELEKLVDDETLVV